MVLAAFIPILVLSLQTSAQHPREVNTVTRVASQKGNSANATRRQGEWVVAGFLGMAHTNPSSLSISQPALGTSIRFAGVRFAGRSFDPPLYYGYRGGYFFPGKFSLGVEAEFIHLKVYADPRQQVRAAGTHRGVPVNREMPLGQVVQQYSISHGVNLLLFNLAGRYGIRGRIDRGADRVFLTARFGAGPTIPHTESRIDEVQQEQYEMGRFGWQASAGVEVKLWRGLYGLGEYKHTRTRQRGKINSGNAESLLRTHHGVVGLSYHF